MNCIHPQAGQNPCNCATSQNRAFCNLADQIVLNPAGFCVLQGLGTSLSGLEGITTFYFVLIHLRFLLTHRSGVLQLRNNQLVLNMSNSFLNQLFTIKRNRISILVVDVVPKCLEFLLIEIIIQRVVRHLGIVTIGDHILQDAFIKHSLHQLVNTLSHRRKVHRQRCKCASCKICTVLIGDFSFTVDVSVFNQIVLNIIGGACIDHSLNAIYHYKLTGEVFAGGSQRTVV